MTYMVFSFNGRMVAVAVQRKSYSTPRTQKVCQRIAARNLGVATPAAQHVANTYEAIDDVPTIY